MRILIAAPFKIRSIPDTFTHDYFLDPLCAAVLKAGHELILLTSAADVAHDFYEKKGNVTLYVCKIGRHGRLRAVTGFRGEIRKLSKVIREENAKAPIDVCHAHWCYEYASACLEALPHKTMITVHDWPDVVCPMFHNYYWNKRQQLGNRVIQKANTFIAVSPYIEALIRNRNNQSKIVIIPNSINLQPTAAQDTVLSKAGTDRNDKYIILCVNNGFSERKNMQTAMRAFSRFHEQNPKSTLVMCGYDYGPNESAQQWALHCGVDTDGMIFAGEKPHQQLEREYERADVFLHVSREESFGIVLLEAMHARCAVIGGKHSGAVPWVLEDGKSGLLVDVEQEDEIIRALEFFSEQKNRESYIQNGLSRVQDFEETHVLQQYLQLYETYRG